MSEAMVKQSLEQASQEYLKLLGYITDLTPGTMITYQDVQEATGIPMTTINKSKLRRAILRSRREYAVIPGQGYRLAEARMVEGILVHRLQSIDSRVKRADKAQRVLQKDFYKELKPEEKKTVLFIGSVFGAIRLAADNGKKLYSGKTMLKLAETNPVVPE